MLRNVLLLGSAIAGVAALPAHAQTLAPGGATASGGGQLGGPAPAGLGGSGRSTFVAPYIEVTQVLDADLTNDDVVTYTQLAAGIDAGISTSRTSAQVSYRYERRIAWDDDLVDDDVHTGLAAAGVQLTRGLSLDGAAIATRSRNQIGGAAPGVLVGDVGNVSQLYSVNAGPSLDTVVGPVNVTGAYRFGYTKVEVPNSVLLAPGDRARDYYDDSTGHVAQLSAGVAAGDVLPIGVTVSAGYEREDAGQLDQEYEGKFARGDVVLPVSRTLAVRGGVGYEKIRASQKDALVDATGEPVLDKNGRYRTDPNSPERIAYDTDGLIYDAGVVWRPNPRLELQANAGWRYGDEIYFGALTYQAGRDVGLQVVVYDAVQTFGRQLRRGLDDLPTQFQTGVDPFGQQFNGCVFGSRPGAGGSGAGNCLNDVFQSIATASYRARGIDGVLSVVRGRTSYGFGAGYANRKLYAPRVAPGTIVYGAEDQSYYAQAYWSRALSRASSVDLNLFGNYYEGGQPGDGGVWNLGGTGTYSHQFGRLSTLASLGVYTFDQTGFEDQWSAQALLGARYTF